MNKCTFLANGFIFTGDLGNQIALASSKNDGSAKEVRLDTDVGDEFFGGVFIGDFR